MSFAFPIGLTVDGMRQLQGDLTALRVRRESLIDVLAQAPEDADIDLHAELYLADRRIAELQSVLARAQPLDRSARAPGVVSVGSRVTVRWDQDGEETYTVVDPAEIAPSEGRISHESPVGQALLERRVGDRVAVDSVGGPAWLELIAVD